MMERGFSFLAQNLFNWYPFANTDRVLILDSVDGAWIDGIHGRCSRITVVEENGDKAKSLADRYRDDADIRICHGNPYDLTPGDRYDYILMSDVFEDAGICRNDGWDGYLKYLSGYLTDAGSILLALDNRFGIQYFAGAKKEEAEYFKTVETCVDEKGKRFFSKKDLILIADQAGYPEKQFYYPYPNHHFPFEIFTDESIQTMGYGRYYHHFEENSFELFDISGVCDGLAKENVMDKFANSFLVRLSRVKTDCDKELIYAKISSDRKPEFRIGTNIYKNKNGEKFVVKYPLSDAAKEHIHAFKRHAVRHNTYYFLPDNGKEGEDRVCYEFLEGENFNHILYETIKQNNEKEIIAQFSRLSDAFFGDTFLSDDIYTDEFIRCFGNYGEKRQEECVHNGNIDLIADNIYRVGDKFCVIDYEWVIHADIPKNFIIWRMINEIYSKYPRMENIFPRSILFEHFCISSRDEDVYYHWSLHFVRDYIGADSLREEYREYIPVSLGHIADENIGRKYMESQLYMDDGHGFCEENSVRMKTKIASDGTFWLDYSPAFRGEIKGLRFDPDCRPCICKIDDIRVNGKEVEYCSNAQRITDEGDVFYTADPWYLLSCHEKNVEQINIKGHISSMTDDEALLGLTESLSRVMEEKDAMTHSFIRKHMGWLHRK